MSGMGKETAMREEMTEIKMEIKSEPVDPTDSSMEMDGSMVSVKQEPSNTVKLEPGAVKQEMDTSEPDQSVVKTESNVKCEESVGTPKAPSTPGSSENKPASSEPTKPRSKKCNFYHFKLL